MADGYYQSWTNYRCGVCQKFFHLKGPGKTFHWGPIDCPHCAATLESEPLPPDAIVCSGVAPTIWGTGIPSGIFNFPVSGVI